MDRRGPPAACPVTSPQRAARTSTREVRHLQRTSTTGTCGRPLALRTEAALLSALVRCDAGRAARPARSRVRPRRAPSPAIVSLIMPAPDTVRVRDAVPADVDVITEFNACLAQESEGRTLDRAILRPGVAAVLGDRG